jgi:hypothetical protein
LRTERGLLAAVFLAGFLDVAFEGCAPSFRRTISAIQTGA